MSGGFVFEMTLRDGEPALAMDAVLAGLGPLTPDPSPPAKPGGEGSQVQNALKGSDPKLLGGRGGDWVELS